MRIHGTGFPAVGARHGIPLPVPGQPDPARGSGAQPAAAGTTTAITASTPHPAAAPVRCRVCGLLVAAAYAARTGADRHAPCRDNPQRMAQLANGSRPARAARTTARPTVTTITSGSTGSGTSCGRSTSR